MTIPLPQPEIPASPPGPPELILLVTPDPAGLKDLKNHLRQRGFAARTVSRWATLFPAIDKHQPTAVVLATDIESITILEGLRLIQKVYPHLPVMVMGPPRLRDTVFDTGIRDYFNNTLSSKEISARLQLSVQRHHIVQENQRLQHQILHTEAYLAHILDRVDEAIITTNLHGIVQSMNHASLKLLQINAGTLVGHTLESIMVSGDDFTNLGQVIHHTLMHGSHSGRFLLARGQEFPVPVYIMGSTFLDNLQRAGAIILLRDLTHQEELELRLEESERLAALGQIAAGMAHEIRNPLTSIGGLLRRLNKTLDDNHPGKGYVPVILDSIKRMENMVREIDEYLHYIQSTACHCERLDAAEVIRAAYQRLKAEPAAGHVSVILNLEPALFIEGDRRSLEELFWQLAHNACEALDQGGELHLASRREGSQAVFTIADTGRGISLEHLSHIYRPFYTTKLTGAGMGLTKVYMIVERHRGQIEVQSRPGQGTTFTIHLPALP